MRIQLTALSGFIYWGSIKIAPSTDAKVHKTKSVRCVGIFRIWWAQDMIAVIGVFLAPNYRPTNSLSWPRVGSASNFNQTLGRLNRRKENKIFGLLVVRFLNLEVRGEKLREIASQEHGCVEEDHKQIQPSKDFVLSWEAAFKWICFFAIFWVRPWSFLSRYTLTSDVAENKFSIKIKTMKISIFVWNIYIVLDCKAKMLGRNIRIVA